LPVIIMYRFSVPEAVPLLVKVGLVLAMTGFTLLVLQVIMAGRFKAIDRPLGYDVVIRFHKRMAVFAMILLICHPILFVISSKSLKLLTMQTSWQVNLGKAALILLLIQVFFALYFEAIKVDYNIWRFSHKGMVFVVILGFLHGIVIGPDIKGSLVIVVYWCVIFLIAAGIFGFRNLVVPFIRQKFTVSDFRKETHDTYTLTFEPQDRKSIYRNPGQFMFLKLIRPGRKSEIHPFTVSASPLRSGILQATIKQSGNFTDTIDQTKQGDIARIEVPFGRFSYVYHNPEKILFIAGGVGITPIMSMIRCLAETEDSRQVTLLYGNKTEGDIIFRSELEKLPKNFKTIHVLSRADDKWNGEKGYISKETIEKYAGDMIKKAHVYLCGPPAMMDSVIDYLRELGVSDRKIHYERFTI
jgi:predicted ferric reductase